MPHDHVPLAPGDLETPLSDPYRPSVTPEPGSGSLNALHSMNFSLDLLPATPTESTFSNYRNNSTNQYPSGSSRRLTRPKLGIFLMDENNFAISEDGSPIQDAIDNTPRARRSFHFGGKYVPVIPNEQIRGSGSNQGVGGPSTSVFYQSGGNLSQNSVSSLNTSNLYNHKLNNSNGAVPAILTPYGLPPSDLNYLPREYSPPRSTSPVRSYLPSRRRLLPTRRNLPTRKSISPVRGGSGPFNFKPLDHTPQASVSLKPAHRKGHKYKHSSVSMNLFQEPPASSKPLLVPDAFPIPTFLESISSVSWEQKIKVIYSVVHILLAGAVFWLGIKLEMPTLLTLAHLVFYDSLRTSVNVFVNIMLNFDVWGSLSLQYPFGLGRVEVLAGFALATSLVMVGLDLISHSVEEFVIEWAVSGKSPGAADEVLDHSLHHIHGSKDTVRSAGSWVAYFLLLIVVVLMNLLKVFRGPNQPLKQILSAESLTPAYAITLMVLPLLPELHLDWDLDEVTTLIVAILVIRNGWVIAKELGGELLLLFPSLDYQYHRLKQRISDEIVSLNCYKQSYKMNQFFVTKFNRTLFVVGIRFGMHGGSSDDELMLRFEVNRVVRGVLSEVLGKNVEITIDIDRY